MKQIRFGDLVRASGRPSPIELWTEPQKHRELQKAIKAHRVLTVRHHNVGNKRDVGHIGFRKERDSLYLVFPRALKAQAGPVVGINWELLEQPAIRRSPEVEANRPRTTTRPAKRAQAPTPIVENKHFGVKIRATIESVVEVEAESAFKARTLALESARIKPLSEFKWIRATAKSSNTRAIGV